MKTRFILGLCILCIIGNINYSFSQTFDFELDWSTYFGDESVSLADNAVDSEGNIYFVGNLVASSSFDATAGSFQPTYGGGNSDGFMVKMNPQGQIVWATYFGGEHSEYISGITIASDDEIYIVGVTSSTIGIATPNSFQPVIDGISDTFVARFSPDGNREWATYYPDANANSQDFTVPSTLTGGFDIVADNQGFIYFYDQTSNTNAATTGVFQTAIGQASNNLITKFTTEGERVWATYYGINFSNIYSIAIGQDGLYVAGTTLDCPPNGSANTYFATAGCHQPEPGNCKDAFVSKFSLDGNRVWSTYYGNSVPEFIGRSALLTDGDALYLSGVSIHHMNITTPGSYQENTVNNFTSFLVKFNSLGERQWGTYIGLNQISDPEGFPYAMLDKDSNGNIYIEGLTRFADNISTPTAFQLEKDALNDTYLAIFNPNGELQYGTYFGSNGEEYASKPLVYGDNFYLFGITGSTEGITTPESYQPDYIENSEANGETNIFIAKFQPGPLGVKNLAAPKVVVFPNPNRGNFTVKTAENNVKSITIYTILGQLVQKITPKGNTSEINIRNLETGLYFVTVTLESNNKETLKIVVE